MKTKSGIWLKPSAISPVGCTRFKMSGIHFSGHPLERPQKLKFERISPSNVKGQITATKAVLPGDEINMGKELYLLMAL